MGNLEGKEQEWRNPPQNLWMNVQQQTRKRQWAMSGKKQ